MDLRNRLSEQDDFVLILGREDCDHVRAVSNALLERGEKVVVFNSGKFPEQARITLDPEGDTLLQLPRGTWRMSRCRGVYWRSHEGVTPKLTGEHAVDALSIQDSDSLLDSLLNTEGPRWFNGYRAWAMHRLKPVQLQVVRQLGVRVPPTLITNDAGSAREFYRRGGGLIHKPVFGGSETQAVTEALIHPARLKEVFRHSPVTLQRLIEGGNARTFVIGWRVFTVEIHASTIDFRLDPEHRLVLTETPGEVAAWAFRICQTLHMNWTAIDWRVDGDGRYWFLEANPSPMFVGLSRRVGLNVADMLAEELAGDTTPAPGEAHEAMMINQGGI